MNTGENFIGFNRSALGDVKFKTFNPQSNESNQVEFFEATTVEINEAVRKATEAFKIYRKFSGQQKASFLRAIAEEILALDQELIDVYCSESGLPAPRAMGERGRTVGQLNAFAQYLEEGSWVEAAIDTAQPDRQPLPKVDLRKMMVPLGPIVVFGASNFPLAFSTAGGDVAAALAAGCPVIVKSHPMHAGTGELVAQAVIKAAKKTGMPDGVFSNLNSSGIEVGAQLVKHPGVKGVGFTGSLNGGRALYDLASKREEPIPVFAEMGSINPVVLMPKAIEVRGSEIATTYAGSITLGSGQFCTNPGLILGVKNDHLDQFLDKLSEEIVKIEPGCMLHPNIIGAYESNKKNAMTQNGVEVVASIEELTVKENYAKQLITTVDGETFLKNSNLHHEVFGPYSMVVQCDNLQQLEEIIGKLEGQLTGTIIAENDELVENQEIIDALQNRVGRIIFNGVPTGVEVCPSMQHGGPYPASTDSRFTAVGVNSIKRWVRPMSFQSWPNSLLPDELKDENPLGILRSVDGEFTNTAV